jgi:hypothetical protein
MLLLGMIATQDALPPSYLVLDAWERDTFEQDILAHGGRDLRGQMRVINPLFLADAFDRILSRPDSPIYEVYMAWRNEQQFPAREVVTLYPYTSQRLPQDLAATVSGPSVERPSVQFELPLPSRKSGEGQTQRGLTPEAIDRIIEFARSARE